MKGVVLAGGKGTRLRPVTLAVNKHLLPVYDRPMVCWPLRTLAEIGVREVVIVTGPGHVGAFRAVLAETAEAGAFDHLRYAVQEREGGIADALLAAEPVASGERLAVILGDNIFPGGLASAARAFAAQKAGARVVLARVGEARDYGVARLDALGRIAEIIEKPARPPTNLAVTGAYFYGPDVFDRCRAVRPGPRGELEISTVNDSYAKDGLLEHTVVDGPWSDAGTFAGLHRASVLMAARGAAP